MATDTADGSTGSYGSNDCVIAEYHFGDNTVVINGVEYSIFALHGNHIVLSGLTKSQIFELAYDVGGEVRARQYEHMIR